MISEGPTLIEALPDPLQRALDGTVVPPEVLRIAVKAGSREAVAASDQRVLLLKEPLIPPGSAASVTEFPVTELGSTRLDTSTGGARLHLLDAAGGDLAVVDVPIYDAPKFNRVVERLNRLAKAGEAAATSGAGGTDPAGAAAGMACPKCAAAVPEGGVFCPACRLQVADPCAGCGRRLKEGWQYCAHCGASAMMPALSNCPNCSEPVWVSYNYCTECGAAVRPRCPTCHSGLMTDWDFCPACGGPTGADEAFEAVREQAPQQQAAPSPTREQAPVPEAVAKEAEDLNAAGVDAYGSEQIDEAISLFQRAIVRSPHVARYHTNLAVAYGEKGMDMEAFTEYRRSLELDENDVTARLNLGVLYSERERYEQAREEWERVVAIAPDSEEAQEARESLNRIEEL